MLRRSETVTGPRHHSVIPGQFFPHIYPHMSPSFMLLADMHMPCIRMLDRVTSKSDDRQLHKYIESRRGLQDTVRSDR